MKEIDWRKAAGLVLCLVLTCFGNHDCQLIGWIGLLYHMLRRRVNEIN